MINQHIYITQVKKKRLYIQRIKSTTYQQDLLKYFGLRCTDNKLSYFFLAIFPQVFLKFLWKFIATVHIQAKNPPNLISVLSLFLPFTLSKANIQVILEDEKSHLFSLYLGLESFLKCIALIFHYVRPRVPVKL